MFHTNLKERRILCGLSQKQVADFLNISPQSVSKWERGDALPSIEFLPKLAECLNCEINDFFSEKETKNTDNRDIDAFFSIMVDHLKNKIDTKGVNTFVLEHPNIIDKASNICMKLSEFKTITSKTIEILLGCSGKEAKRFLEYLIQMEMIEKLDIGERYFVVKHAVEGMLPLMKMIEKLCEVI
ncbi:MAG: helix-turn-helix domain-containing protein [Clostridia bacterium]|nr:helix-turn-helix domain-containing protein [Clostridia bacterium]